MHPMLNTAVRAARTAGNLIVRYVDHIEKLTITSKQPNDFVTEVDQAAEQQIIQILHKAYPHHAILAEESGQQKHGDYIWIIDPLDGTTNFVHGFPHFAISIALQYKNQLQHAVIYDPIRQELFTASKGEGALLNDRRIRVTAKDQLGEALLGTGFPFRCHQYLDDYLAIFKDLLTDVADLRRPGAATLDLAYVASGRLDGFWELGLQPWDMAAGALLIQEAGGMVTDFTSGPDYLTKGHIIAGNPKIQPLIAKKVQKYWE